MNELELYTRTWGATAVPFGPLSETQWLTIPSQQRAVSLLSQTAALRSVMLLSGGNGMGKSTLVGRWVRQLEPRLYTPVNLTQATLSSSGLLASLARGVGKRASMRRERNLDELSSYLSEHERQTLLEALSRTNRLYRGALLIQSDGAVRSTLAQYRVGKASFAGVLDVLRGLVADEGGYLESLAQAQRVAIAQREVSLEAPPGLGGALGGRSMPGAGATGARAGPAAQGGGNQAQPAQGGAMPSGM